MSGKTEGGREFQFLEVTGTNVLANEVVRDFSNLTMKKCWEFLLKYKNTTKASQKLLVIKQFKNSIFGRLFVKPFSKLCARYANIIVGRERSELSQLDINFKI